MNEVTGMVSGEYHQFYIQDDDPKITGDEWTAEALEERVCCGEGFVGVSTLSSRDIKVTLKIKQPNEIIETSEFDLTKTVITKFNTNSINIAGCVEDPKPGSGFGIVPGMYQLVICYGAQSKIQSEFDEGEYYLIYIEAKST